MLVDKTLDDIRADVAGGGMRPWVGFVLSRGRWRLRPNQQPAKETGRDRQTLPDRARLGTVQRIRRGGNHQAVRLEQMLETLRDAPPRRIGPPVQLRSAERAERRLCIPRRIVESAPDLGE